MTAPENRPPDAAPPAVAPVNLPVAPPAPLDLYQHHYPYPYPYPSGRPRTNGMAIASMVLGILWLYWIGSILALIFGYMAREQNMRTGQGGDGMAIAGIVLGWVGVSPLSWLMFGMVMAAAY